MDESWSVAAWELIRDIDASGDPGRSVGPEADRCIAMLGSILVDPATSGAQKRLAGELLDGLRAYRWQVLPPRLHGAAEIQAAAEMFVPFFLLAPDPSTVAPEGLMPALVAQVETLADEARQQAMTTGDPDLHDLAVQGLQQVVAATPADDPERAARVSNLATALWMRHEHQGAMADLERAVATAADAVDAIREDRLENASILSTFGATLLKRFQLAGAESDLATGVRFFRAALDAGPVDRTEHAVILQNLGAALMARIKLSGSTADLAEAIETLHSVLAMFPEGRPEHTAALSNLGDAMFARFEESGELDDLERSAALAGAALEAAPRGHPDYANYQANHAMYLAVLGDALADRYRELGTVADLNAAIDLLRAARDTGGVSGVELAAILADLAGVYQARFERFGAVEDSDDAIDLMRAALGMFPAGAPEHAAGLANLAAALKGRFDHTGECSDLDVAVEAAQTAANALPAESPHRISVQLNLGATLYDRFSRHGAPADLDGAVEAAQRAVEATPPGHPALASCLSNLGNALRTRFAVIGNSADLNRAVRESRAAVDACPKDHVRRPVCLLNLSKTLLLRFERSAEVDDINEAVDAAQDAVNACPPDNPQHAECLGALADVLRVRAKAVESAKDVDDAVTIARRAVDMTPPSHSAHSSRLVGLGDALFTRFKQFGENPVDLDEAVSVRRAALEACPPDAAPERATRQAALGEGLKSRFECLGDDRDAHEAFRLLGQAGRTQFATPSQRVDACRVAADIGASWDPHESAELLEMAIGLLPELAGRHLQRADQHHALGRLFGQTSNAAALALADDHEPEADRAVRALRLLEAGRAVLLSQALDTRSDLTDLHAAHPELARRYIELRDLLDRADPAPFADTAEASAARPDRRALSAEFDALVERIQRERGFASFNKLPDADELLKHAADGPVATINVSAYRSDAILLTSGGITSLPLPELRLAKLTDQIVAFHTAVLEAVDPCLSSPDRQQAQATIRSVLAWLWGTVAEPVLKALRFDAGCEADEWPRMWWAPGGLLGLLPLHAAGRPDKTGESVLDRVVSSYTPTIRALQYARRQAATAAASGGSARSLIVAMPTTPGPPDIPALPGTALEAARVATRLPEPTVLLEPDPHSPTQAPDATPTRSAVLERLPDCSIAHFACHGEPDFRDPSRSCLLLHDHATAPLTVADLAPLRLERVELAYLSACDTAANMSRLIDEAVHLAAAFQLAGFPRVVGTLWAILDATAATVADAFYAGLAPAADEALDSSRSAFALHHAVRALRDKDFNRNLPSLWAAYQHFGA